MGVLDEIVEHKRREVASRRAAVTSEALHRAAEGIVRRDFESALRGRSLSAIAEIKRRSPSGGEIRPGLDPVVAARDYSAHGAAALSVLTDERFFGGGDADLRAARDACPLPVLRKDFTIDEYQVEEAAAIGADAVLLIVRILDDAQLRDLLAAARRLDLAALVECHDSREIERAVAAGSRIIGVNNRDLDSLVTRIDTCIELRRLIPPGCIAVAESGLRARNDVRRVEQAGYDAILVGESLLRAEQPGAALAAILGRGETG